MAKQRSHGQGSLFRRQSDGPWVIEYFDADGRRRRRTTRTTDRRTAERIAASFVENTALRKSGLIDPRTDRFATEGRKPLIEHVDAYLVHFRTAGRAQQSQGEVAQQLRAIVDGSGARTLAELTPDALERHLFQRKSDGLSARTVNRTRAIALAFANWSVKTGRLQSNPLGVVPKLDETTDRRRVRRPLAADELQRLLDVARDHGREAWYLAAFFAGLRRSDMRRLQWVDVDLRAGTLAVRGGKAKRVDTVPIHPELAASLGRLREANRPMPLARIWPTAVTNRTRQRDFERACIPLVDEDGRVADLHALRMTLGTQLARTGVAPQVAQRLLRHSTYSTTLKHYTSLSLMDDAAALERLPAVGSAATDSARATGTAGRALLGVSKTVSSWGAKGCNPVPSGAKLASESTRSDENKNPGNRRGFTVFSECSEERTRLDSNQRPSVSKTDALSN